MRAADFAFLDNGGAPLAFAHRGGAGDWPENTMPAFAGAVALGYRYVETDVHVTADGVLLAFHDDVLDRVTDREGVIAALPWSTVREARVDGREPIPLLEDLLGTWPELLVNIDPKHDRAVDPLIDAIQRTGARDRVCVGSFSDERIATVRDALPGICTSLGPIGVLQLGTAAQGVAAAGSPPPELPDPCAQVPTHFGETEIVTETFVGTAHELGLQVHVWTIDDPAEMQRLLELGVDGIMTDRPAVFREVLERRGQWRPASHLA